LIKFKKFRLLKEVFSLLSPGQEEKAETERGFNLAISTPALELGKEMADLLSLGSGKEIPVFNFEPLPSHFDLVIFLLLDLNKESLFKIKSLIKNQSNYLVLILDNVYLPLAFRVGREVGIPSHRLFVWKETEDYHDFLKGALKLAGSKRAALARSFPVFFFYWQELLVNEAALNLGWQAFWVSRSFPALFLLNIRNFKRLFSFSNQKLANGKESLIKLSLFSLPLSFIQLTCLRASSFREKRVLRSLSVALSTFLAYRLLTSDLIRKKIYER
jgi:hypothetical protein